MFVFIRGLLLRGGDIIVTYTPQATRQYIAELLYCNTHTLYYYYTIPYPFDSYSAGHAAVHRGAAESPRPDLDESPPRPHHRRSVVVGVVVVVVVERVVVVVVVVL